MNKESIWKYAVQRGIIDPDGVLLLMKKEEILKQHKYKITKGKDGRWRTYIPTETGRKLIAKSSEDALYSYLYSVYCNEEKLTLRGIYPKWLKYKSLHTTAKNYIDRINVDWKKYYISNEIIDIPLEDLDKMTLDNFAHTLIQENNMTKNQYYNATIILRQALDYAVDTGVIPTNPFSLVKVDSRRMFRKVLKKPDETQVFNDEEFKKIIELAYDDYLTTKSIYPLAPLAVIFQMNTGVRVGELCALQYSDIERENYIHVQRMLRWSTGEVVDHTKTSYGDRLVPLTDDAKKVIALTKTRHNGSYIFSTTDSFLPHYAVCDLYVKYCKKIGCTIKRSHKSRKTYISTLIDANVNINSIRKIVGHADERTTLGNYCFDRKTEKERFDTITHALKKV